MADLKFIQVVDTEGKTYFLNRNHVVYISLKGVPDFQISLVTGEILKLSKDYDRISKAIMS